MTRFKVDCAACGHVEVAPGDMLAGLAGYFFRCPRCHNGNAKPAAPGIIQLLVDRGVETTFAEIGAHHAKPPISLDEALDFLKDLFDDERFNAAVDEISGPSR